MLVVVVQEVGHEGGVVRQVLAHPQDDGLAGEQAVPSRGGHPDIQNPQGAQHPAKSHPSTPGTWPGLQPRQEDLPAPHGSAVFTWIFPGLA